MSNPFGPDSDDEDVIKSNNSDNNTDNNSDNNTDNNSDNNSDKVRGNGPAGK